METLQTNSRALLKPGGLFLMAAPPLREHMSSQRVTREPALRTEASIAIQMAASAPSKGHCVGKRARDNVKGDVRQMRCD